MSSSALEGASKYLNNLLLARGLLKDGKSIDFAHPANDSNSTDETMSKIINLMHDLVLRRDRDAEQRDSLAASIRNLKSEENQHVLDLERLQDKNVQLKSDVASAEAQQRTLELASKKAEKQAKELREQMLKLKSTLDQVRAKCISDVRKRDVEIEKLKNHLSGMQRGKKDSGGMKIHIMNPQPIRAGTQAQSGHEVNASQWSLEHETNDFLAALVDETSTENVALRKIVNDSIAYLKDLTGFEQASNQDSQKREDGIGIPGQYRKSRQNIEDQASLVPVQTLAVEIAKILDHCRVLLKDPSFVPIEEVQLRDEEIEKLRAGWEKMADRWKEAVTMMSQWRQKMVNKQDHPDYQEHFGTDAFSGLGMFGRSVAVRPDGRPVLGAIEEEELSSMLFDHSRHEDDPMNQPQAPRLEEHLSEPDEEGTPFRIQTHPTVEDLEEESDLELVEGPSAKKLAASPARRGIRLPRPIPKPLSETNANIQSKATARKSKLSSHAKPENGSVDYDSINSDENENFADLYTTHNTRSKLPRLTVAEKLAAVEAEANEATQDLRMRQATQKRKPSERSKKTSKSGRRRSTLSPEELAQLMGA